MQTKALAVTGADYEPISGNEAENKLMDAARGIVSRLTGLVQEQKAAKQSIERRWLEDLKLFYGLYDPVFLKDRFDKRLSSAFVKLTRNKTNGWEARLADLLFPTDDRNWGIKPTPIPKLEAAAQQAAEAAMSKVQKANETADNGDPVAAEQIAAEADLDAQRARATHEQMRVAKERCGRMQETIEDQLTESNYQAQCRDVLRDGCRIGTGVLKGPLTANRLRSEWREGDGGFVLEQDPDKRPEFRWVDPWHFFPDMSARRIEESEFTFERSLPTRKDLRRYARKFGFNPRAVSRLLKEGPNDLASADITNLRELRAISEDSEPIKNRYEMWEFNGPLECSEIVSLLRAVGDEAGAEQYEKREDPFEEHRVIIFFIGEEVLKIAPEYPLDSGDSLYSVWNFEPSETSMFGYGVPNACADSQRMINGAWRMMSDNSSLSVGPQIVVDKLAVTPDDGNYDLRAMKVWYTNGPQASNAPPFQVFNIPNNQQQLAGIIELGKAFMDEETSLPLIAQGEQGAATQTMNGMSMLFNSANVVFRRVVKSFDDDLTTPTIRRAYDWNMQFNPDDNIKGDMQVDARGTSVLLVKEIQSQNLLNIVTNWTVHPVLGAYVKVRPTMEQALQTMMIPPDEILFSQEEAERRQAEAAKANQPPPEDAPPPPEDNSLQIAQIEADSRLHVAEMNRDIKIMEMSENTKVSIEDIQAKLEGKRIDAQSRERMKAADIGVERQRAEDARVRGVEPEAAVGTGIG